MTNNTTNKNSGRKSNSYSDFGCCLYYCYSSIVLLSLLLLLLLLLSSLFLGVSKKCFVVIDSARLSPSKLPKLAFQPRHGSHGWGGWARNDLRHHVWPKESSRGVKKKQWPAQPQGMDGVTMD